MQSCRAVHIYVQHHRKQKIKHLQTMKAGEVLGLGSSPSSPVNGGTRTLCQYWVLHTPCVPPVCQLTTLQPSSLAHGPLCSTTSQPIPGRNSSHAHGTSHSVVSALHGLSLALLPVGDRGRRMGTSISASVPEGPEAAPVLEQSFTSK